MNDMIVYCQRCNAPCKVGGHKNEEAKMLRRSEQPKGFCVNCAVHDWLRNTYPVNQILAGMRNPAETLRLEHIQQQFIGIMRVGNADANPDEIDWERIIENWDLPFKDKVKGRAMNPASQAVLDMEPEIQARRENYFREERAAIDEGFESLSHKQEVERERIIQDEFLPFMRKLFKDRK